MHQTVAALLLASHGVAATLKDSPYEEIISTRLTFEQGPSSFPVLPFTGISHQAAMGDTRVAVLANQPTWGLFSVDTAVEGAGSVLALALAGTEACEKKMGY